MAHLSFIGRNGEVSVSEATKSVPLAAKESANVDIFRRQLELVVKNGEFWLIDKLWSHDLVWGEPR